MDYPTLKIRPNDTLSVDGEVYHVHDRCDVPKSDKYMIEHNGEVFERHIDWFSDLVYNAGEVRIDRTSAVPEWGEDGE